MSRIRSRDTRPELQLRRALHAQGLRYRLHDRTLPGTPDLVFSSRRAVIFVHGCFWHGHDCPLGVTPGTRTAFWEDKIGRNRARDRASESALQNAGWRVLTVWECALRGRDRRPIDELVSMTMSFLHAGDPQRVIRGHEALDTTTPGSHRAAGAERPPEAEQG